MFSNVRRPIHTCLWMAATYLGAVLTLHIFDRLWRDEMLETVIQRHRPALSERHGQSQNRATDACLSVRHAYIFKSRISRYLQFYQNPWVPCLSVCMTRFLHVHTLKLQPLPTYWTILIVWFYECYWYLYTDISLHSTLSTVLTQVVVGMVSERLSNESYRTGLWGQTNDYYYYYYHHHHHHWGPAPRVTSFTSERSSPVGHSACTPCYWSVVHEKDAGIATSLVMDAKVLKFKTMINIEFVPEGIAASRKR